MVTNSLAVPVVSNVGEIRRLTQQHRAANRTLGLVPTMGALHEGHLSLVRRSCAECDETIVTIFVNPTQFGENEDFSVYPRTLDADLEQLQAAGASTVFVPSEDEVYGVRFSTWVDPPEVARPLEGACRPGHFRGVATIVLKLFNMIPADTAFFGQKDYQQSLVIRKMVDDLNVPIRSETCPIVREPDGLAMSSRNARLNASQREQAAGLSRALRTAASLYDGGERDGRTIRSRMQHVLADAGIDRVDYATIADRDTLEELARLDRPAVALVAAHVGDTRLIDNQRIG